MPEIAVDSSAVTWEQLRDVYAIERRWLETQRTGRTSHFKPSRKWEGVSCDSRNRELSEDYPEAPKPKNVWQIQLAKIRAAGHHPLSYVHRLFSVLGSARGLGNLPTPQELTTQRSMDQAGALGTDRILSDVRQSLFCQLSLFQTARILNESERHMGGEESSLVALVDASIFLRPLFRYCLLCRLNTNQSLAIAEGYDESARAEYSYARDEYDRVWGDLIPDRIRLSGSQVV